MLPGAVVLQVVEPVAGRVAQVLKHIRRMDHRHLGQRAVLDVSRHMLAAQAVPDALSLGAGVGEGEDHIPPVFQFPVALNRDELKFKIWI